MDSRSFSGKYQRPAPEFHVEEDGSFGAVITPWGPRSSIKRAIETLSDFILSAKNDMEATSPFQKLTCLSGAANTLRAAVMLTNDILHREENKNEYVSGVEAFVFSYVGGEVSFVQVGQPQVLLWRENQSLTFLSPHMDLSQEWTQSSATLAPLPNNLLGIHRTTNFQVISFKPQPGDRFILLSRTRVPASILQLHPSQITLDSMSKLLSQDNKDEPFWISILPIKHSERIEEDAA